MVDSFQKQRDAGVKPNRKTIFHGLIDASDRGELKGIRMSRQYLVDEAFSILGAAAETVANSLTVGAYHILSNPHIYSKLTRELGDKFQDKSDMTYTELNQLPYLTAVIKEALRLVKRFPDESRWISASLRLELQQCANSFY